LLARHFAVGGSYLLLLMKAKTLTVSAFLLLLLGPFEVLKCVSLFLPPELALAGEQQ